MRFSCLTEEGYTTVWVPGPEASVLPGSPLSPLIPLSPGAPLSPLSPGGPLEPGAPCGPTGPAGPGIQEDLARLCVYFPRFSPHCLFSSRLCSYLTYRLFTEPRHISICMCTAVLSTWQLTLSVYNFPKKRLPMAYNIPLPTCD